MKRDNAKVKRFAISDLALITTYQTGAEIHAKITHGFPPDGVIVRHYYDRDLHSYFVVVQSEEFEAMKNGDTISMGIIAATVLPCGQKIEKEQSNNGQKGAPEIEAEGQANVSQESQPGAGGSER
jgi:hypothetical protein